MFALRIRTQSACFCHPRYDPRNDRRRRIGGNGLALYPSVGAGEKASVYGIYRDRQRDLVAVASAFVFHTGSRSVRAKLFRIWNQRIGTVLRPVQYQKKYGQRMALRIVPQSGKRFIGDL